MAESTNGLYESSSSSLNVINGGNNYVIGGVNRVCVFSLLKRV